MQVAKFAELVKQGEMSKTTFHEWLDATPSVEKLPDRVTPTKQFKSTKIKSVKVIK